MDGARQRRPGRSALPTAPGHQGREQAGETSAWSYVKTVLLVLLGTVALLFLILCLVPCPIQAEGYEPLPEPPAFEGPLKPNDFLAYTEKIFEHQLQGPESIAVDGGDIYTGTADGWVTAIKAGVIKKLVRFGKDPCGGHENENTCGRPLGMRMGKDGLLVVLDAYYGLFKVNVTTGDYSTLYLSSTPVNGNPTKLLNDLDIGLDGKIYFTDSSTRWHRNQFLNILFERAETGRLLQYDPSTKEVTQVLGGLIFPNGVQLNKDKSAVLVVETCNARVLKFDLKTKKSSVWADNLPGFPDNIRYSSSTGNYWLGMAVIRQPGKFSPMEYTIDKPWIRGMLAKVLSMKTYLMIVSKMSLPSLAVEMNEQAEIVGNLQAPDAKLIKGVSEVEEADGVLYLGSFHAPFIGRLDRKKVPGL